MNALAQPRQNAGPHGRAYQFVAAHHLDKGILERPNSRYVGDDFGAFLRRNAIPKLHARTDFPLLRTEAGFAILEKLMGDARPTWWRKFRITKEIGELRRDQAELKRRIADRDDRIAQLELKV